MKIKILKLEPLCVEINDWGKAYIEGNLYEKVKKYAAEQKS